MKIAILPNKEKFVEVTRDFEYIPFPQSIGWHNLHACTKPDNPEAFIFLADSIANPTIACFGFVMKFLWMKMLLIEGECIRQLPVSRETIQPFYQAIQKLPFDFIEINSHLLYTPEYEIGIRKAGYLRPVGLFSTQLSKIIHLQQPISLSGNWKRNLQKARKNSLKFELLTEITPIYLKTFMQLYAKLLVEKKFSHTFSAAQFGELLKTPEFSLACARDENDEIQVTFIIFTSKGYAQSMFCAKSEKAKQTGATFFAYHETLNYLKNSNYQHFDMGRMLASSTQTLKGVFDFKDGVEGEYITYCGEWAWYKRQYYRPLMFFVKKFLMKKRET
ncbi:MAG: hypothetical protein LBD45_09000 [Bacteroidales bacterium]|jgi:hypothetical protein|nr:hypothetical protein [Bacteroidales bacterium]